MMAVDTDGYDDIESPPEPIHIAVYDDRPAWQSFGRQGHSRRIIGKAPLNA